MARNHLWCMSCQRQTSVTAGTIFQGTRKPLRMWFQTMWFITSQKSGGNALGLQRVLGLGSYQTTWAWLHKLRRAMVRPGRDPLRGCVEVDETYVGGEEEGVRGRETEDKAIVAVAAEEDGRGIGRIRLGRILDVSAESLHPFIEEFVASGSVIHTDGWRATVALREAVSDKHLEYYLDEYTFRFNRRRSRVRGLLFYRLLQNAVAVDPITYQGLGDGRAVGVGKDFFNEFGDGGFLNERSGVNGQLFHVKFLDLCG